MSEQQLHSLTIASVQPETDKAVRLGFSVPDELREALRYHQGQYLTLESPIDGEVVRRSYSICSGINDNTAFMNVFSNPM